MEKNAFIFAARPDGSAVELHDLFRDGESQTRAACGRGAGGIQPEELIKDTFQLILGNGSSVIAHIEHYTAGGTAEGHLDRGLRVTVVDRIADQIIENSCQLIGIADKLDVRIDIQLPGQILFR